MVSPEFPQNVICPFIKFILRRDIFHKNFPKTMTLIRQKEPQREPQKEAKKTKWEWLKKVGDNILRIIGALALIFAVIKGGSELKDILSHPLSLQISKQVRLLCAICYLRLS